MSEAVADPFDAILELGGDPLRDAMADVERRLREITAIESHSLATIAAGGKRLRPLIVFVAGLGSDAGDALSRAAAAVELIHSATLVHDDVLDDAPLRRGRRTVFAAAGRDAATATGDLLFSSAFSELARNGEIEQLRALSSASAALACGELMQRADAWRSDVTLERYLRRCELKTARLFAAACELGALSAGASPERAGAYAQLGVAYGVAFQIEDDVLGTWGDSATTGKPCGADLAKRKWTFPVVWALAGPPSAARAGIAAAYARGTALTESDVTATMAALELLGARAAALRASRDELRQADALTDARGIDRSGRVRGFFQRAARRVA